MLTPIPLSDCLGLIDLMLTGEEHGESFTLNGVQCDVVQVEGHACFEAAAPDFGLSVIYPGWYVGEHDAPAQIAIVGDAHTCLQWLPIDLNDALVLIERLPLDATNKVLCRLSVA
jgi:hypothetical protein